MNVCIVGTGHLGSRAGFAELGNRVAGADVHTARIEAFHRGALQALIHTALWDEVFLYKGIGVRGGPCGSS